MFARLGTTSLALVAAAFAGCSGSRSGEALTDTTAANAATPAPDGTTDQQIRDMLNEYLTAYYRGDATGLQRFEADDFVVLYDEGFEEPGPDRYPRVASAVKQNRWFPQPVAFDLGDTRVRRHGDVAITYGKMTETIPGKARAEYAVSSTWVRGDQEWEVVQFHFTPVRPKPAAQR